jgi:hypothetical protein
MPLGTSSAMSQMLWRLSILALAQRHMSSFRILLRIGNAYRFHDNQEGDIMKTTRMLNGLVIVVGFWEALAPYTLGYSRTTVATWNAIIIGEVLVALAVVASILDYIGVYQILDRINAGLGLWLILSPFILGYSAVRAATWNDTIVGVVIITLALWAAFALGKPADRQS